MRMTMLSVLRWSVLGLVALAAGLSASAATLRWKFKPGETLHYVIEQKTTTTATFTIEGKPQEHTTALTQTIDQTWAVKEVDAQGTANMTLTFNRLRTKINEAGVTFEYDSNQKKDPEGPIADAIVKPLKALVGATFTCKMSPSGELSDVKMPESLAKALRETSGGGGAPVPPPFTEEGLKTMIAESSFDLPKDDLAQGSTWTRKTKSATPIGAMLVDKTFRYEGPDDKGGGTVERVSLSAQVAIEPAADSKLTLKVQSQEGKGSFLFDSAVGRMVSSHISEKMDVLITVMNMDARQNIETTADMKLLPAEGEANSSK